MTLLLFKLFATPLIVGIAGWVSRRWGTAAGGWVAGLPVTTGPISVFLFVEYGADFSIQAALGTLYAMPAIAATAAGYRMAVNFGCGWVSSQATAQGCYLAMAFFLAHFNPDPLLIFLLSMGSIIAGLGLAGSSSRSPLPAFSSNTVLVLRMAVTTALVLVITVLAPMLGPMLSGLLGTVLIVAGVLAAAAHREHGSAGGLAVMRGMMQGQIAFLAFYFVIWSLLPLLGFATYLLALTAAGLAGVVVSRWQQRLRS